MRHRLLPCLLIVMLGAPAMAQDIVRAAPLEPIVDQMLHPPAGMIIRTLAIRDIVEAKTLAHSAISDWIEQSLSDAISKRKPAFAILNNGLAEDLPSGSDAVLSGVYQQDAVAGQLHLSLVVREAKTDALLFAFPPYHLDEASLPERSQAAERFGRLVLNLDVPDALVLLDGSPVGSGSLAVPVTAGPHLVTIAAEGYDVYEAPVSVLTDSPALLNVHLLRQIARAKLETQPSGAQVSVDGKERGATPIDLDELAPGKHRLAFNLNGYQKREETIDWEGKRPQIFRFDLKLRPGNLLLSSDVPGALISLDQQIVGRVPLLLSDLSAGPHQLSMTAPGYSPLDQIISVASGKTTSFRAKLSQAVTAQEEDFSAIALVAKTGSQDESRLISSLHARLAQQGVPLVEPSTITRTLDRVMPDGFSENSALVRTLTHQLKAKRIALIHLKEFIPFSRLGGIFPLRPQLKVTLSPFRSNGNLEGEPKDIEVTGGEPWSFAGEGPGFDELSDILLPKLQVALSGERATSTDPFPALLNETGLLLAADRYQLGLSYERRVLPNLSLGCGYSYLNAFGNDRTSGPTLRSATAGPDLVYGLAQSHLGRLDALLRLENQAPRKHPYFDGPRFSPYLGIGYRLDLARYEVYGVGRKESEGNFWQLQNRAVVLSGLKLNLYGTSFRAEVEVPVAYQVGDSPNARFTLGCGWLWQ